MKRLQDAQKAFIEDIDAIHDSNSDQLIAIETTISVLKTQQEKYTTDHELRIRILKEEHAKYIETLKQQEAELATTRELLLSENMHLAKMKASCTIDL